jgi:tellurite resistance protein
MSNRHMLSEIMVAYRQYREDQLLDAVVTAAALVARADGWVDPEEREQLLDFLDRQEFLSVFTYDEILEFFERRVRHLREPGGTAAAIDSLRRRAGRLPARLIIGMAEEVAAADCRLDPREEEVVEAIRDCLRPPSSPAIPHAKEGRR